MQFDINQIDRTELQKLNLIDKNGNILINKENLEFLRQGKQTDDIDLKEIALRDKTVDLKASLSLYNSEEGVKIRIHPYYKQLENNQLLSEQERKYISENAGVHSKYTNISGEIVEHGKAKYKFDDKQQDSYFVKLKNQSGTDIVWGVNLQKELEGKKIGDMVTVKYTGKEKVNVNVPELQPDGSTKFKIITTDRNNFSVTPYNEKNDYRNNRILIEFNKEKNSFEIVNSSRVPKVQSINGEKITKEQQEQLERGEEISVDGSKVKYSPQQQTFVQRNNNRLLIASLLLDGGLSYLLIKTAEKISQRNAEKEKLRQEVLAETQKENKTEVAQKNEQKIKEGVDKEYIMQLEKLRNEIDNKMRQSENKKELSDVKDYISKEIDRVSATPYQESDLEQRPEHEQKMEDAEQKNELPFDEDMVLDSNEEIKHNDLLDDSERDAIERQEIEFNEREMEERDNEEELDELSRDRDDDGDGEEDEDEEQERSRGRAR